MFSTEYCIHASYEFASHRRGRVICAGTVRSLWTCFTGRCGRWCAAAAVATRTRASTLTACSRCHFPRTSRASSTTCSVCLLVLALPLLDSSPSPLFQIKLFSMLLHFSCPDPIPMLTHTVHVPYILSFSCSPPYSLCSGVVEHRERSRRLATALLRVDRGGPRHWTRAPH